MLQLSSKAEKEAMLDFAIGESLAEEGSVEIVQGDRRRNARAAVPQEERRRNKAPVPVIWQSLRSSRAGGVAWVAAHGGLISNLKVWENITLPLWYHASRDAGETERNLTYWLGVMGLEQEMFAEFMAAPPYRLEPWQRKFAGLLRALVQAPKVLVIDAVVFEEVQARLTSRWITALEAYAAQGHAVLLMADKATTLPWEQIK